RRAIRDGGLIVKITEAVKILASEYPMFSKTKLTKALKIEMNHGTDVASALEAARKTIRAGALDPNAVRQHTDHTANEVQTRVGKSDEWKAANPHGYMATRGHGRRGDADEVQKAENTEKDIANGRTRMRKMRRQK